MVFGVLQGWNSEHNVSYMCDFKGLVFHFSDYAIYQLLPACSLWNITNMNRKSSDFCRSYLNKILTGAWCKPVKVSVVSGMCPNPMFVLSELQLLSIYKSSTCSSHDWTPGMFETVLTWMSSLVFEATLEPQ